MSSSGFDSYSCSSPSPAQGHLEALLEDKKNPVSPEKAKVRVGGGRRDNQGCRRHEERGAWGAGGHEGRSGRRGRVENGGWAQVGDGSVLGFGVTRKWAVCWGGSGQRVGSMPREQLLAAVTGYSGVLARRRLAWRRLAWRRLVRRRLAWRRLVRRQGWPWQREQLQPQPRRCQRLQWRRQESSHTPGQGTSEAPQRGWGPGAGWRQQATVLHREGGGAGSGCRPQSSQRHVRDTTSRVSGPLQPPPPSLSLTLPFPPHCLFPHTASPHLQEIRDLLAGVGELKADTMEAALTVGGEDMQGWRRGGAGEKGAGA